MARAPKNADGSDNNAVDEVLAEVASGEVGDVTFASEACRSRLDEMANLVSAMTPADRTAVKAALAAFAKTL